MKSRQPRRKLVKVVDELTGVQCASGPGVIRDEVWEDQTGEVARYNLAFINHFLTSRNNGRVLGDNNAHGKYERHFMGTVEEVSFHNYQEHSDRSMSR